MRKLLIVTNGLLAIFFVAAFAYTFIGKDQLLIAARDFATVKTAQYAAPLVDLAEQAANSQIATKLLNKSQEQAIADEIAHYRSEPNAYIADLTGNKPKPQLKLPSNPLSQKINGWKDKVRDYFEKVVGRITLDLRIFAGTNLVAALIALGLVLFARGKELKPLISLSGILVFATLLSIYAFIDSFAFYQYLFNWHMGWSYPAMVLISFLYFVTKFHRFRDESN